MQLGRYLSMFQKNLLPPAFPIMKMKLKGTSKTVVNFYQTTQCDSPQDSNLRDKQHSPSISFPDDRARGLSNGLLFCTGAGDHPTKVL
jgi:hypothetical protein